MGSSSIQPGPCRHALRAPFRLQWNRSTKPLAWGWYAVVECCSTPRVAFISFHRDPVNRAPRSDMIRSGTPSLDIQTRTMARTQVAAEPLGRRQGPHQVHVHVPEAAVWGKELVQGCLGVPGDF